MKFRCRIKVRAPTLISSGYGRAAKFGASSDLMEARCRACLVPASPGPTTRQGPHKRLVTVLWGHSPTAGAQRRRARAPSRWRLTPQAGPIRVNQLEKEDQRSKRRMAFLPSAGQHDSALLETGTPNQAVRSLMLTRSTLVVGNSVVLIDQTVATPTLFR